MIALSKKEAAIRLNNFRGQRLRGDFIFEFDLEHMPRRGESRTHKGVLWGTWNSQGPLMRASFSALEGVQRGKSTELILQNGSHPRVWKRKLPMSAEPSVPLPGFMEIKPSEWFQEILTGVGYVPFDLLMPFTFWEDTQYQGTERVKGRPAHLFLARPPVHLGGIRKGFRAVRFALDDGYNTLLRVEILGPLDKPVRTFKILSFKKLEDDQWIVKTIGLINEASRDKARLEIRAAAIGGLLPGNVFDPRQTATPQPPELKRI